MVFQHANPNVQETFLGAKVKSQFTQIIVLTLTKKHLLSQIYVFLWFWFVGVAIMSGLAIVYRMVVILVPSLRCCINITLLQICVKIMVVWTTMTIGVKKCCV